MTKFSIMLLSVMMFLVALIPHIIYFLAWVCCKLFGGHVQYAPFGWCALCLAVLVLCFYYYGNTYGRWKMDVEPVELGFETLPASFDGYKIVHISDFHLASFIGHEDKLQGAEWTGAVQTVAVDGKFITSRGMGTSLDFGLKLIEVLVSREKAQEIANQVLHPRAL